MSDAPIEEVSSTVVEVVRDHKMTFMVALGAFGVGLFIGWKLAGGTEIAEAVRAQYEEQVIPPGTHTWPVQPDEVPADQPTDLTGE